MKINLKSFIISLSLCVSVCLGIALGVHLRSAPVQANEPASTEEIAPPQSGRFVQEPQERQSFRRDYSSSSLGRGGFNRSLYNRRTSPNVLGAFSQTMDEAWKASVRLLANDEQVALGLVVDPDGWIVTKASQLPDETAIICRLFDYRELRAEIVDTDTRMDIALLRVQASRLPAARWADTLPNRGNFVLTADVKSTPTSLGVVSTGIQRIPRERSVLGVSLKNTREGAYVTDVLLGTGAFDAGLREKDVIYEVNGTPVQTLSGFKQAIRDARGGDFVALRLRRGESELSIRARLMDLTEELFDETEMEVNGRVSARATGFDRVFLHDTVLKPHECGGALVNLDGQVVGLNIARAGRVTSYALPFDVLKPTISGLVEKAKLVSHRDAQNSSAASTVR
ncbi:MAG: S1C family serine protease [Aureliella sp.]